MSGVLPLISEYQNLRLRHRQAGFLRLDAVVDERKFPDALRGEQSTYVCNGLVHGVRDSLDKKSHWRAAMCWVRNQRDRENTQSYRARLL
jgi:hypothetical protein